jgi:hypothetical protein
MWALYPWFEEQGTDKVHPDDLAAFRALGPAGKVFRVVEPGPPLATLEYRDRRYRVHPALMREVADPGFRPGQAVLLEDGSAAEVTDVLWHHQRNEPFFQLAVGGKRKSRRYWASELRPAA